MAEEKRSPSTLEKPAPPTEKNGEQPQQDAQKKNPAATFSKVIFGIISLCMIWFTYAVKTGHFDQHFRPQKKSVNVERELALGFAYYKGVGMPIDLVFALSHFLEAARAGNAEAQFQVGSMLAKGSLRIDRDMGVARDWLRRAAGQGHAEAWIALGDLYAKGADGSPQDKAEAADRLRKAAGKGNDKAQAVLKNLEEDMAGDALPEAEQLARAYACLEGRDVPQDKAAAARWFRKAAAKGNVDAQWRLAILLHDGDGEARHTREAEDWFRKAAEKGHADAQYQLAMICKESEGVRQDMEQAAEWFRKAAEQGHAGAQYQLALMCRSGEGLPQDTAQAAEWLRKAAGQGLAEAQCSLGAMIFKGNGVPQDKAQAVEWFRKAAAQGNAMAQNNLGFLCNTGDSLPQDKAQAREWFRKAAEQGLDEAQYHLGIIHFEGDGVPQDLHEAARWLEKAANQGHEEAWRLLHHGDEKLQAAYKDNRKAEYAEQERANREELIRQAQAGDAEKQYALAESHALGIRGLSPDISQIIFWLRKAGEQNHLQAQTWLARIYYEGEKVPQDKAEAAVWLRKAAGQGDVKSQEKLARMYHVGDGIPRDVKQAIFWYRKLAEEGSASSMMEIAKFYARGDGVPRDMAQAISWSREAAVMGDKDAPSRLGRLYAEGNGVPRDMHRAILWYHWAAEAFNDDAMLELGRLHAEGDGVPQDKLLAAAWYKRISTMDYRLEEKVRKALQALKADERLLEDWKEVIDSVQTTRVAVARFELSRDGDKTGKTEDGRKKFAWLRFDAGRTCSRFLEETWQNLKKAGNNVPPPIRDMAAAVSLEAEKVRQAAKAADSAEQPAEALPQ